MNGSISQPKNRPGIPETDASLMHCDEETQRGLAELRAIALRSKKQSNQADAAKAQTCRRDVEKR